MERQKIIEQEGRYPPIVVFPEGGTSNGTSILSFKKGAFAGLHPVRPIVLKYRYGPFSPAYDILPFLALYIMQCCRHDFFCTVNELPPFVPNDYLYQTHGKVGQEKWEIYADAL